MAFDWTIARNVLKQDGDPVEQVISPNSSGKFASTPKIVVMHYTAGGSGRSSANWFRNRLASASAHVVIDRDGTVIQCVPFDKVAWHAGRSRWGSIVGLNRHSIGIELANWGPLQSAGSASRLTGRSCNSGSGWTSHTGVRVADPFMAAHRNGNPDGSRTAIGWEAYPEAQMESARGVLRALIDKYGIDQIVGHDDIAPVRKHDPGPAFNMTRFRNATLDTRKDDGDAAATVNAASGLNLRAGPGTDYTVITTLANGTKLELLGEAGAWLEVTSLSSAGVPDQTGWVHGHYVKR